MPVPANLVHQLTTGTGTGNLPLTAVPGKQTFGAAFPAGTANECDYFVSHRTAAEWEYGTAHVTAGALVRDTVIGSSNANAAVNFSAGDKDVTNDIPAAKQVTTDTVQTLSNKTFDAPALGTPVSGALANCRGYTKAILRVYTVDATWTKPSDVLAIDVWGIAAGGSTPNSVAATNQANPCSGGGHGTYGFKTILAASLGATEAVTVGVAVAASAGEASSFGSHMTLPGGPAGVLMGSGTTQTSVATGLGTAATGADWSITGGRGARGYRWSGTMAQGGDGAASIYGPGGNGNNNSSSLPAVAYGAGGGGPCSVNTTTRAGALGGNGVMFVLEYY